MFSEFLFRKIDNSQLVIFRIIFGLLIVAECWGAIFTGWVNTNMVEPKLTFTFIGFEWMNNLLGPDMVYYFGAMGFLGILISLGFIYRFSIIVFAIMWTIAYLMQKTSYNNHYYLFMLVSWMMTVMPAHQFFSIDSLIFPRLKRLTCKNWVRVLFIAQLFIVYTFAAFAKLYPDWFNGVFLNSHFMKYAHILSGKYNLTGLGQVIGSLEFSQVIAILGFLFDLLIIPAMLIKQTRGIAIKCAIFFHLFNAIVFGIGIFPFFSLAMMIFFYDPIKVQEVFFKTKSFMMDRNDEDGLITTRRIAFSYLVCIYILWQFILPLRHYLIPGNVFWTEEGHRLSWRMMLRSRTNDTKVYIAFPDDKGRYKEKIQVEISKYLTFKQETRYASSPDMIWQMAHYIKEDHKKKGKPNVMVFVDTKISINGSPYYQFTNPKVDLAKVNWSYFGHQGWILPQPKELKLTFID